MKLWSDSWTNGDRIPARYAAGKPDGAGGVTFSDNLNPHLAWSDLPAGAQSMVLICHDFDVPSKGDDVNQPGREVPADLPRVDFFHWVLIDLPPRPAVIAEGEFSRGFVPRGKPGPQARGDALPLPTRTPVADVVTAYVEHIRTIKTPKSAQTEIHCLRDMFGPICEALRITSRKVGAKSKKRPPKPGQDRRRRAPVIEANSFEQITAADISAFIAGRMASRGLLSESANSTTTDRDST